MLPQFYALRRQDGLSALGNSSTLHVVDPETGEVMSVVPIPRGTYSVGALVRHCRRGQILVPGDGVTVIPAGAGGYTQRHPAHYESAANPTFRVTNAMRVARKFELGLRRMEVLEKVTSQRLEVLKRSQENQIPVNTAPDLELDPAPELAPEAEAAQDD